MKLKIVFQTIEYVERYVKIVSMYEDVSIDISYGKYLVDGKSLLGILSMGLNKELEINILTNVYPEELPLKLITIFEAQEM